MKLSSVVLTIHILSYDPNREQSQCKQSLLSQNSKINVDDSGDQGVLAIDSNQEFHISQ